MPYFLFLHIAVIGVGGGIVSTKVVSPVDDSWIFVSMDDCRKKRHALAQAYMREHIMEYFGAPMLNVTEVCISQNELQGTQV